MKKQTQKKNNIFFHSCPVISLVQGLFKLCTASSIGQSAKLRTWMLGIRLPRGAPKRLLASNQLQDLIQTRTKEQKFKRGPILSARPIPSKVFIKYLTWCKSSSAKIYFQKNCSDEKRKEYKFESKLHRDIYKKWKQNWNDSLFQKIINIVR